MNAEQETIVGLLTVALGALASVIVHLYRQRSKAVEKLQAELDDCQELNKQLYDRLIDRE